MCATALATGYNPTDYFREGAVGAPISIQPGQPAREPPGGIMLRAQRLWDGGSLTALTLPPWRTGPTPEAGLDVGATNAARHRALLALSQRIRRADA